MRLTILALALAACGSPTDPDPCEPGFLYCESETTAAWCELGETALVDCPGGCASGCDFAGVQEGAECPADIEGSTFCAGPDLYECASYPGRPPSWSVSQVCREGETCAVDGPTLACLCPDGTSAALGCD